MKENFSKRVQNILKKAKEEAIRLGHSYVGSEHILLGLLKEQSGVSHKLLDANGIEYLEMIAMIEDLIKEIQNPPSEVDFGNIDPFSNTFS